MPYTINYRRVKGSPLTNDEVDDNFENIEENKAPKDNPTFTGTVTAPTYAGNLTGTVTSTGVNYFGVNTSVGNGATANVEVDFYLKTANLARFYLAVTGTAGATFSLQCADNAGAYSKTAFTIDRATGITAFNYATTGITPATADNSTKYATTAYVQAQGYITSSGTAAYVTNLSSAQVTGALTYTPVQQGTGIGQGPNVVKIGWTGSGLKVTVDSSDQGYVPFSSTAPGTFTYSGAIVASGNITAYSDETLKTNWQPLADDFIEKLADVKSGTFDRTDTYETQVGVGAQSLREVLTEAVVEGEDGLLSVAYGNAALAACVALAQRVVELEARLKKLEG